MRPLSTRPTMWIFKRTYSPRTASGHRQISSSAPTNTFPSLCSPKSLKSRSFFNSKTCGYIPVPNYPCPPHDTQDPYSWHIWTCCWVNQNLIELLYGYFPPPAQSKSHPLPLQSGHFAKHVIMSELNYGTISNSGAKIGLNITKHALSTPRRISMHYLPWRNHPCFQRDLARPTTPIAGTEEPLLWDMYGFGSFPKRLQIAKIAVQF